MEKIIKEKKMKRLGKIIIICVLILFAGHKGFAQSSIQQADTLKLKEQKSQSAGNEQNAKGKENSQNGNRYGYKTAKRVRSGRPDMTRARGARPPSIVRPSGSGIPKGVGKPAGAGRKGGR
jgi:hypothetical protein